MLEKFYLNKEKILKKSQEFFSNSNSQIPKVGCELEFFLLEKNSLDYAPPEAVTEFILELKKFYKCEKERGVSQIEIKTDFTADLAALCRELDDCKNHVAKLAEERNLRTSFLAQPFLDDCGSSLQFNITLHDFEDKNLFLSDEILLKNCASSLLLATNSMMIFLAPTQEDYQRFDCGINQKLFENGNFSAPINLSFGVDNRTCAIRIPATTKDRPTKRLEYRLAATGADPWLCISAMLLSLKCHAELNSSQIFEQIYGNAFDEQYQLKSFCKTLQEAEENFWREENFIRKKFEEYE